MEKGNIMDKLIQADTVIDGPQVSQGQEITGMDTFPEQGPQR